MLYQASASVTNLATQIFNSIWYLKNLTPDNNANVFLQSELLRYFKTSCEKKGSYSTRTILHQCFC